MILEYPLFVNVMDSDKYDSLPQDVHPSVVMAK